MNNLIELAERLERLADPRERFGIGIQAYYDAVSEAAPALRNCAKQEPVAWMYTSQWKGDERFITRYQSELTTYKADLVWPLYAAPTPPIDREAIMDAADEYAALSAAHGNLYNTGTHPYKVAARARLVELLGGEK